VITYKTRWYAYKRRCVCYTSAATTHSYISPR